MSDIVERIRSLRFVHVPGTSQLLEEAANEIERLQNIIAGYTDGISPDTKLKPTFTDEEREAVKAAIRWEQIATLRKLLGRNRCNGGGAGGKDDTSRRSRRSGLVAPDA